MSTPHKKLRRNHPWLTPPWQGEQESEATGETLPRRGDVMETLVQGLMGQLKVRRRKDNYLNEYPAVDSDASYDDENQEPAKPPEDYLPSFFQPGRRLPPREIPPIEFNEKGQPLKPKLSEDRGIALQQKLAHARAVMDYDPKNNNSKLKSVLLGLGRGALKGFAAGGPGGAIFGAAAGGVGHAIDPSQDEKYAQQQTSRKAQSSLDWEQQQRQLDTEYNTAMANNKLKSEQAENLQSLPGRERDRQWESLRKDLIETYNKLAEYDPQKSPQLAKALLTFGIDAPAKSRAKNTQIVIDQKTGEARVLATDQTSGTATAAPVMAGEKPLVTTTAPMMARERQDDSQTFQREQQGRNQEFRRWQVGRRETSGNERFTQRQDQQRQQRQQKLIGEIDGVIASLGRFDKTIADLQSKFEKTKPDTVEADEMAKQLAGAKKNRELLVMRGGNLAAQLNTLGDYEARIGERDFPYYKERPGRVLQRSGAGTRKYSEPEVRERARRAGKDENAAVQAARAAGLIP